MHPTTASNAPPEGDIADFYLYNEKHELRARVPEEERAMQMLRENPHWYARIVRFANQPPIVLAPCPHCGQVMPAAKEPDDEVPHE